MVIGSRYLGDATSEDDDIVTAFGNWLFTRTVNLLHGGSYTDAMGIYRAFRRGLIEELELDREAPYQLPERLFWTVISWEPLMSVRAAKRRMRIAEVPVGEPARIGGDAQAPDRSLGRRLLLPVLARALVLALRRPSNWFERLALAGAVLFVAHLVSRYDICFQDGEVQFFQVAALKDGPAFGWRDLRAALDTTALDGDYRPRVISYLAFIVTVKTRLALWQIFPPHPSFSPLWLLTVGVAPLLLYRFLRLELRDRGAALAGVAVYLVSAGFLSGVTMIFHPGKPLANVLVIGAFYLCARINATPVPSARLVATLLGLLTLAPFVDETAVFAWVVPFVWCSYCRRRWLVFAAPALLAVFVIVVVAPTFSRLLVRRRIRLPRLLASQSVGR